MTRTQLTLLATLGSAGLLLGAFGFQYIGGYAPCHLCLLQRWPHAIAVLIGGVALFHPAKVFPLFGAVAAAVTAGIGAYHAGVEWKWWPGPTSCTGDGGALSGLSGADLLSTTAPVDLVMCDQIVWSLMGISMAGWNAILSVGLVIIWLTAARKA